MKRDKKMQGLSTHPVWSVDVGTAEEETGDHVGVTRGARQVHCCAPSLKGEKHKWRCIYNGEAQDVIAGTDIDAPTSLTPEMQLWLRGFSNVQYIC
jgi:hypothetical protein